MRATTTLIAAAAVATPLLVSATPSPSYTDLYAREEFAPYVSARNAYGADAIFRRGNTFSKPIKPADSDNGMPPPDKSRSRNRNNRNGDFASHQYKPPVDQSRPAPGLRLSQRKREDLHTRALLLRALLEELD
ncbi:uncharacterized protein FIBRA_08779 [Fibroporia radiculosa]|uniref:Uncharacterized protein n=1 Tax=Fibroporia radiculosa TaxID=599839 RepID=J4GI82_9APHY|nr:uncharacterized protein FIBRA_08779 [Fibroporia radiculosa]CCM06508.1 predicted protein [Fibroporia radiculosa]